MRAQTPSYVVSTKIQLPESIANLLEKSFRISNSAYNEALINLEEKLQKELANFDKTKPYRFFFIDYGQPSKMSCKLVPSENDTIFINIVHEQRKKTTHKKSGNIDITYTVWADECEMPDSYHALTAFYENERTVNATDDLVKTMTEMIQEIFDAAEQDN